MTTFFAALTTAAIVLVYVGLVVELARMLPRRLRGVAEFVALGPALWVAVETIRGIRELLRGV